MWTHLAFGLSTSHYNQHLLKYLQISFLNSHANTGNTSNYTLESKTHFTSYLLFLLGSLLLSLVSFVGAAN